MIAMLVACGVVVNACAIVLGLLTTLFGRWLYEPFVSLVGFAVGLSLAPSILVGVTAATLRVALALGFGVDFAILAVVADRRWSWWAGR